MSAVPYEYARALEHEGRHPHDAGQWGVTGLRLMYVDGLPAYPYDVTVSVDKNDRIDPTSKSLHNAFRNNRHRYYRRVRSSSEAAQLLSRDDSSRLTKACFPIFSSWVNPDDGIISLPAPGDIAAPEGHAILLKNMLRLQGVIVAGEVDAPHFIFDNSWGINWGKEGQALLPFAYYDQYMFDQWFSYNSGDFVGFQHKWLKGNLGAWQAKDEFDRRVYGFEVGDPDAERIGWAFAIERDGAIEVEELFVAHAHRRTGVATRLAERLAELAKAKGLPLRVWVSFADVASESPATVAALPRLAKRMGVEFQRSPVRWAGYYATNEMPGSPTPVEPERVPGRPKSTLGALAAFAALAVSSRGPATLTASPSAVTINGVQASGQAWPEQNRRRIELIRKRRQSGLDAAERIEFDFLQSLADAIVDAQLPPPLFTPAERAYIDSKAAR